MTRDDLEALARVPEYRIVPTDRQWAIAESVPGCGSRVVGDASAQFSSEICQLLLAELHRAIDTGCRAGLAQALLAPENEPAEAAALARRACRRLSSRRRQRPRGGHIICRGRYGCLTNSAGGPPQRGRP
jgi:hypothetical protein